MLEHQVQEHESVAQNLRIKGDHLMSLADKFAATQLKVAAGLAAVGGSAALAQYSLSEKEGVCHWEEIFNQPKCGLDEKTASEKESTIAAASSPAPAAASSPAPDAASSPAPDAASSPASKSDSIPVYKRTYKPTPLHRQNSILNMDGYLNKIGLK